MGLSHESETGIVYFAPNLEAWKLDNAPDSGGLVFEKELIYADSFVKDDRKNAPVKFGVDDNLLLHWHNTVQEFRGKGYQIPVPLEHTTDPTKTRGEVIDSRVGKNVNGKNALFVKIKFNDPEAAILAKHTDVSLYSPTDFVDGKGKLYNRPIRHVALTNYPTIPGLGKFEPIAASFTPGQQPQMQMPPQAQPQQNQNQMASPLLPLAQQLGVPNPESLDDAAITTAIVGVFQLMKDKIDELEGGGDPNEDDEDEGEFEDTDNGETDTDPNSNNPKNKKMKKKLPPAFAASFGKMLKDNRTAKLDALVLAGNILPPVRDDLVALYCSDPALALSLDSIDEDAADISDKQFDALVESLKKNRALKAGEKSGPQINGAMALSNPAIDAEENPLIADAEKRAKEFAASRN